MHKYAYTYIYTCIYMHKYKYIHVCTYVYTHIYTHTYHMYICTHASTPGTTAWQRLREKPDLKLGSSTLLPVRAAHRAITTARHPDYTRSYVLVRDHTRSMTAPAGATEILSRNRVHIPFSRRFQCYSPCTCPTFTMLKK